MSLYVDLHFSLFYSRPSRIKFLTSAELIQLSICAKGRQHASCILTLSIIDQPTLGGVRTNVHVSLTLKRGHQDKGIRKVFTSHLWEIFITGETIRGHHASCKLPLAQIHPAYLWWCKNPRGVSPYREYSLQVQRQGWASVLLRSL